MKLLRIALFPFTLLYSLVIRLRNHLYNIGYTRSFQFEIPVIVVGNLSVGGSGKTPAVVYLTNLLGNPNGAVAVLSRGYKRRTHGFRIANDHDTAETLGDEPYQLFKKFGNTVTISVGEDRAEAIPKILFEKPETRVVLMDDGFQHRSVTPSYSVLLTSKGQPFYSDYLLPTGNLREHRKEAKRANCIIVTKCQPNISEEEMNKTTKQIQVFSGQKQIYFSTIKYADPKPLYNSELTREYPDVMVVTGIADSEDFEEYLSTRWNVAMVKKFPDHEPYPANRLKKIKELYREFDATKTALFTTEKDVAKFDSDIGRSILMDIPVFYIPIVMEFIKNGPEFDKTIQDHVSGLTGNRNA